jgi:hypothetical protein
MHYVHDLLMILAIVCFFLSAVDAKAWLVDRSNLVAAGLGFWAVAVLLGSA